MEAPRPQKKLALKIALMAGGVACIGLVGLRVLAATSTSKHLTASHTDATPSLTASQSHSATTARSISPSPSPTTRTATATTKSSSGGTVLGADTQSSGRGVANSSGNSMHTPPTTGPTPSTTGYCWRSNGPGEGSINSNDPNTWTFFIWEFQSRYINQALYETASPGSASHAALQAKSTMSGLIVYVNGNWWGNCPGPMPYSPPPPTGSQTTENPVNTSN